MTEMTSRQRVLAALQHREPDRVPLGIWMTVDAYKQLRRYLGLEVKDQYPVGSTTWSQDVGVELDVIDKFDLDVVKISGQCPGGKNLEELPDGLLVDEWGIKRKRVEFKGGSYLEIVDPPLADAKIADLDDFSWPDPLDPAVVDGLREKAQFIRRETDLAIAAQFGRGGIFEQAKYLRGYDKILFDMAADPDFAMALFEKLTQIEMGFHKSGIQACGEYVDILRVSPEDLATMTSTFISPKMFENMVLPFYQRSFGYAKKLLLEKNPNAKLEFHSCGAAYPFMQWLVDAGMDIFDSLQPRVSEDSHPVRYKQDFGDRLAFWGGIDVQQTLPQGTPEEVREEVRVRIGEMAPGGGYILSSSHRLQPDIPPENIIAMYEAAKEFGTYPIQV